MLLLKIQVSNNYGFICFYTTILLTDDFKSFSSNDSNGVHILGDSGYNPFDDFNSSAAPSQDNTNGVTDNNMGGDLHVENSAEEEKEFQLLEAAFNTLVTFEKLGIVLK